MERKHTLQHACTLFGIREIPGGSRRKHKCLHIWKIIHSRFTASHETGICKKAGFASSGALRTTHFTERGQLKNQTRQLQSMAAELGYILNHQMHFCIKRKGE